MDISEEYIKMCDCPEIQMKRPLGYGFKVYDTTLCISIDRNGNWWVSRGTEGVYYNWLPRQDQLQGMVEWGSVQLLCCIRQYKVYYVIVCHDEEENYSFEADSLEQVWLMLVMYKLHNLKWLNGEWR